MTESNCVYREEVSAIASRTSEGQWAYNPDLVRQVEFLIDESKRGVPTCDALHGSLESEEAALLDFGRELAADAARLTGLVHDDTAAGLVDAFDYRLDLVSSGMNVQPGSRERRRRRDVRRKAESFASQ
jgi:hypothetical protein